MDKIMYSISDLNNVRLSIVCRVSSEETFDKLSSICPKMHEYYDNECEYYLTSRDGIGGFDYYNYETDVYGVPYKIININDIDFTFEVSVLDNGIPVIWNEL